MKKSSCIALSLLIILSSTSISFATHYCTMSKKTTFSFFQIKNCCSKTSKKNNCCKNKQFKVEKIKDNYTPSATSKIPIPVALMFVFTQPTYNFFKEETKAPLSVVAHSPPLRQVSLTILNRAILI
jgi:hypothetical protein